MNKEQQAKLEALLDEAKCPECKGKGKHIGLCGGIGSPCLVGCPTCKGTGQDPHKTLALVDRMSPEEAQQRGDLPPSATYVKWGNGGVEEVIKVIRIL